MAYAYLFLEYYKGVSAQEQKRKHMGDDLCSTEIASWQLESSGSRYTC